MKLTDLGRQRRIGANSLLAEIGPFRVLIDAGLDPKSVGRDSTPNFDLLGAGPLDLVVLTHCHLDHLGSLPIVCREHPEALYVSSRASQMLAQRMLRNSVNVMKRQRDELHNSDLPLYTFNEVDQVDRALLGMAFGQSRKIERDGEELVFTLHRAGHIAGAVGVSFVYKHRRIFFTGDVMFGPQATLDGADFPLEQTDTLVMETTRGAKGRVPDRSRESEVERLISTIAHTVSRGGCVLIPVFALGRMQELLHLLQEARQRGQLPECPVFCTGLGMDIVDYFDAITRKIGGLHFRRTVLKALKVQPPPPFKPGRSPGQGGIYLLSSGMMVEHTPSYHAAAAMLDDHANSICFVGYCDPETPGGELLATAHGDSFLFRVIDHATSVRAQIEQFDLSGHADRDELLQFARTLDPRTVALTHGDPEAREWFFDQLMDSNPKLQIHDLLPNEVVSM
ncbi:MBL fold metallo-hydrolase [Cerasicoccus arenae]|uniref:Ysh1p: subunit of polyadenylation factor I n=1 Tax=Cerasicoccus arenae TaxID=424488 RepID=A0A8J3GF81_9BACT|nr:MBL fold metallo-hydrolase [Cerasicoccus arenae]MBK1858822.1 MBL fold metallo-hydrolase [Cerasicoccus arenae]GHC04400.1 Ysh1p: subunit of polyadenylation factor I [Cerasicoccus arenae]